MWNQNNEMNRKRKKNTKFDQCIILYTFLLNFIIKWNWKQSKILTHTNSINKCTCDMWWLCQFEYVILQAKIKTHLKKTVCFAYNIQFYIVLSHWSLNIDNSNVNMINKREWLFIFLNHVIILVLCSQ